MRNIYTVFFLLVVLKISAQQDFRKTYFPHINKAELHLTKEEYVLASQEYFTAFSATKTPLLRDVFNATVCKLYQNDFEGAKLYLFKMAQRGISAELLEQREIFEVGDNLENWKNFKATYEQFFEQREINDFLKFHFSNLGALRNKLLEIGPNSYINLPNGQNPPTHAIKIKDYRAYYSDETPEEVRQKIVKYTIEEVKQENVAYQTQAEAISEEAKEIIFLILDNPTALFEGNSQLETFHTHDHDLFSFLSFFKFNFQKIGKVSDKDWFTPSETAYFDSKLQEAVQLGYLGPQTAVSQSSEKAIPEKIKVTSFTLKIENSTECGKEFDDIENIRFLKKNVLSSDEQKEFKKIRERYGLETLEERFRKEMYAIDKNRYFILNTRSSVESSVVPNCEVALNMLAGATIIRD